MKITALGTSGGQGGYPFEAHSTVDGARIAEIRVLSGWFVDSIQLIYADAAGMLTPLEPIGGAGLHLAERESRFVLDADEYLIGISGTSGQYVDNIRFHTNKRVSDTFGGHGGENSFSFMADDGGRVVGFHGRADWYLDAVGILVQQQPASAAAVAPLTVAAVAAPVAEAPKKAAKKTTAKQEAAVAAPAAEAPKKTAKKTPAAGKEATPEPAPAVAATRAASIAVPTAPDNLTVIEGIGPKIAELLTASGIATFAALADASPERLREILLGGGRRFAIADPTTWPQQAALAASGDTAGLAALQASLKGGRKAS